jgi:golgi phosphoprotein 3
MLSVYEELFLLALDEESGKSLPFAKKTLAHALAGGILAELAFLGKICSNEKHRLELRDTALTGDDILIETIEEIRASEKLRRVSYWVSQISSRPKKLRERIGESLAEKGLLTRDDRRFYWAEPNSEGLTKFEMKKPLRTAILSNGEISPRELTLLYVASAAGLHNLIFTQDELEMANNRIHEKVVRYALGNPVMETVEEIGQAVIASLEDDLD